MKKYKGKTFDFTITRADYMNSSKEFSNIYSCPFSQAFTRSFTKKKILVGVEGVYDLKSGDLLARIEKGFTGDDYIKLKNTGKIFRTQITFL